MHNTFIPKPYSKEAVTIRLEIEPLEHINRLACNLDMSRIQFLNQCVYFALKHMNPGLDAE